MKLTITGRHTDVSRELQHYIRKRFEKWSTFLKPDAEVHVIVGAEGYRQEVEVTAKSGRAQLSARQTTKDMHSSVDLLAEKIGRQLTRLHERRIAKPGAAGRRRPRPAPAPGEAAGRTGAGQIVDIQTYAEKPMSREEARLQILGSREPFLVFSDSETEQLAVLVRRRDGHLTLIITGS